MIWWRRARFSACKAARLLKYERNAERRARNKIFMGLEDYQPRTANSNGFYADEGFSRDSLIFMD
jgi:hypothetical protein